MSHVSPRSPDFTDEEEQGRRVLVPKHVFAHGHLRKFVLTSFFRKKGPVRHQPLKVEIDGMENEGSQEQRCSFYLLNFVLRQSSPLLA